MKSHCLRCPRLPSVVRAYARVRRILRDLLLQPKPTRTRIYRGQVGAPGALVRNVTTRNGRIPTPAAARSPAAPAPTTPPRPAHDGDVADHHRRLPRQP